MPTTTQLPSRYTPAEVEPDIRQRWADSRAFHADPAAPGDAYSIVIPPPNVTAALHMGHALNNTLQDILIRTHRMRGCATLWMAGTDHAGIATQTVVEKRVLQEEGKKRTDFERDVFIEKIQAWKDEYEKRITHQLVEMGCSCDWDRQRFTMDDICARAVREAFFQLFKDGLIYRGKRLVNWDPATQTALADDEVEMRDIDGQFYYLRYPLAGPALADGSNFVTVATTRPETMLGDTAVAVNPSDPRAEELRGRFVILPIVNRIIPIVEDSYVVLPDAESADAKARYATGFLKVTPAHDPNDYEIGQRHNLPVINVMAPDGSISKDHGWPAEEWEESWANDERSAGPNDAAFVLGKDRFEARKQIVRFFKDREMLEDMKPYRHAVGHSYRSHVPIEPYLSDQWYVKVTDDKLRGAALRAMAPEQRNTSEPNIKKGQDPFKGEGQLHFHPPRYAKTFETWHENIRDWCISRQLWWGHRIPVWHLSGDISAKSTEEHELFGAKLAQFLAENRIYIYNRSTETWVIDRIKSGNVADVEALLSGPSVYVCVREASDREAVALLENWNATRDPDVLDTWFSSALWPLSTMGWPDPSAFPNEIPEGDALLERFNPTSLLCTAREIITLWVSRMVMFNTYFRGCLPFTDVFIHAMIQDGEGQKMSKSLGNGVDPLDIIHSHGSDAMRFTLASMTTQTQDVRMPVDVVCPHTGQAFTPKLITASGGHKVAAPTQESPFAKGKRMVTSFGLSSGQATPDDETPLARNSSSKFDYGRNFANKLWNAARFVLTSLEAPLPDSASSPTNSQDAANTLADQWILSRLAATVRDVDAAIDQYEFARYAQLLYDFIWRDFCDWYIEAVKPVMSTSAAARQTIATVLDAILRLLHPVMPFITEKLWETLNEVMPQREVSGVETPASELLATAAWPKAMSSLIDADIDDLFDRLQTVVSMIREVRTTNQVSPRETVEVSAKFPADVVERLKDNQGLVETLANVKVVAFGPDIEKPDSAAVVVRPLGEVYLHEQFDADAERVRLTRRLEEVRKSIKTFEGRLTNENYTKRAPEKLVNETRQQFELAKQELETIERRLEEL